MGCGKPCGNSVATTSSTGGPGTQLLAIMPAYAKLYSWLSLANCGCTEYAAQMDQWGIDGCLTRHEEIVERLVSKAPPFLQRLEMTHNLARSLVNEAIATSPRKCKCGRTFKDIEDTTCFWCRNKERLSNQASQR